MKILQWNCRGIKTHKAELEVILKEHNPYIICLNETMIPYNEIYKIKNYKCFQYNVNTNTKARGGVVTLVHQNIKAEQITIESNLQMIAIKFDYPIDFKLCNMYIPGAENIRYEEINKIVKTLGNRSIILGDLNGHGKMWGSQKTDSRGKIIEEILNENNLIILNENLPTHFSLAHNTLSCIDLALATIDIAINFKWTVLNDLYSSDHFPITLEIYDNNNEVKRSLWNEKKADWDIFKKNFNSKLKKKKK